MPTPQRPTAAQPAGRRAGRPARRRGAGRRLVVVLPALVLAAGLGACAEDDDDRRVPESADVATQPSGPGPLTEAPSPTPTRQEPALPTSTSTAQGVPADFGAELTVAYDDGTGTAQTYDLVCDGAQASGTAPDPAAACAALAEAGGAEALAPPPADVRCTQVFGGPQTATVTGTVEDQPVSADLSRADGCETSRWDALVPLVPPADA